MGELKSSAEKLFLAKNPLGAAEQYEAAIKLFTADVPEKAELLQKTANCYLLAKK